MASSHSALRLLKKRNRLNESSQCSDRCPQSDSVWGDRISHFANDFAAGSMYLQGAVRLAEAQTTPWSSGTCSASTRTVAVRIAAHTVSERLEASRRAIGSRRCGIGT